MFRFEYISFIYAIPLVILVMVVFYYLLYNRRKRIVEKLGNPEVVKTLIPPFDGKRSWLMASLLMASMVSFLVAAANPQYGSKSEKVSTESSDIYIAFDISESMSAQDVAPSRLEKAKKFAVDLIEELKGNRIGLIFFAGTAYMQMPLTTDYGAAISAIKTANPGYAGVQGTSISDAIDKAMESYQDQSVESRALIIISDGEDHEAEVESKASEAANKGMEVFTVGVGTKSGAYVPFVSRGRENYKKDENGNPVISKINVDMLRKVAKAGRGAFYMVDQGKEAIDNLELRMQNFSKSTKEVESFNEKNSFFQYFLVLGMLLILVTWKLSEIHTISTDEE